MNETKTEWNLLLVFYWSIFKMNYFGRINNAKGKHLTLGQCCLFSFCACKRQSWWMHWNVGLNPYSFNVLFSNNFLKWVNFGYGGNMCTWLYMIIYISYICLAVPVFYLLALSLYIYTLYSFILYLYLCCDRVEPA